MKRTICFLFAVLFGVALHAGDRLRLSTVVIDPGHGGKDSGAVSRDKKSQEKTFTLDIAKALADKIRAAYPDVKVILTRTDDRYVTLGGRADIANDASANLFVSIHINANAKSSPNGFSAHVLGQSSVKNRDLYANNMDIVRRENSVILLEDDYSSTYGDFDPNDPESYIFMNLMQNANLEQSIRFAQLAEKHLKGGPIRTDRGVSQDPFLVLWRTAMPAVLLELGFISNDGWRNASSRRSANTRGFMTGRWMRRPRKGSGRRVPIRRKHPSRRSRLRRQVRATATPSRSSPWPGRWIPRRGSSWDIRRVSCRAGNCINIVSA